MWWIALVVIGVLFVILIIVILFKRKKKTLLNIKYRASHLFLPKDEKAGRAGEYIVDIFLKELVKEDEYLLTNLLIPVGKNNETEIDAVIISRKGIFCIEVKNWIGYVSGSDEDEKWLQQYDDPYMPNKTPKNPVKQNENHCRALKRLLNNRFDIFNVVIFLKLEYRNGIDSDHVYTLKEFIKDYRQFPGNEIDERLLRQIHQKLSIYVATEEQLKQHKEKMQKEYGN